jgi:hypothetical protein
MQFVADAVADSHSPGGLKPAVDFRAADFTKKPASAADAPAAGGKVEYMFHSPAAPVPTWLTATAAAAAAVPDPKDKGAKGKKDAKAAAAAAAEAPVAAGLDAEAHLQQVSKTWKELEFISLEDPVHPDDWAALKSLKTVSAILIYYISYPYPYAMQLSFVDDSFCFLFYGGNMKRRPSL